jgi:hypothetical protein
MVGKEIRKMSENPFASLDIDKSHGNIIPAEILRHSEMTASERSFVENLVRHFKPAHILEIGVSAGGSSVVLLEAVKNMPNTTVTSIDTREKWYRDPSFSTGFLVDKLYPGGGGGNPQWTLISGKDPVEVMESLGLTFDFMLLDTVHVHPIEFLNFLTALPYMSDNAVVVLHDIALYCGGIGNGKAHLDVFPRTPLTCKLLFDSVTAWKFELPDDDYPRPQYFPNIGAFQLSPDTWKYIRDLFSMLRFPWGAYPEKLPEIQSVIEKYYNEECLSLFQKAVVVNLSLLMNTENNYDFMDFGDVFNVIYKNKEDLADKLNKSRKIIFYGAGKFCRGLLIVFRMLKLPLPDNIWDIKYKKSLNYYGIPASEPGFDKLDTNDIVIITNESDIVAENVSEKVRDAGCKNCFTLKNFALIFS